MSIALNSNNRHSSFRNFISKFKRPLKTFHQPLDDNNPEFFIDSIEEQPGFYLMTAQGPRLKSGESIKIEQFGQYLTYKVDNIEYYNDPSDIWTAILHKV